MRILKTLTLATAGILTGAGLLVAPFAQTTAHAAGCTFEVRAPSAPVRENPSSASVIRKYKTVWQHVTGPCYGPIIQDPHNHYQYFRPVYSSACTDGICWMATQTLRPV